jgi:hypothetical protein
MHARDAGQAIDCHPRRRIDIGLSCATSRAELSELLGRVPADRALSGHRSGKIAEERKSAEWVVGRFSHTPMLRLPSPGSVSAMATAVLVREGSTRLTERVRSLLAAESGIELVASGETADVIVDLRVGDHDGLGARRSSATAEGESLMAEVRACGAHRIVLMSSALVYGAQTNNPIPITEDAPIRPEPSFVFARQLAAVEHVVDRWRRGADGRSVTVLRPTVTVATGASSSLARALIAGSGQRWGHEDPPAQFLHLDDLASAVAAVVQSDLEGPVNVAPDGWIPGDRVRTLSGAGWRLPLPGRLSEQVASLRWRFQRGPIPPGLGPYTSAPWVVANDRLRGLGWRPTVTNEQAYVEGTEEPWWSSVTPKRRQELALGAASAAIVGVLIVGGAVSLRAVRRARLRR